MSGDRTRAWVSPACSPDRRLVAAAAGRDSHDASLIHARRAIWLLSLDGRMRRQLTRPPSGWSDESPQWTVDGKALIFLRQRLGHGLLYVARLDGTLVGPLARVNGAFASVGYALWPVARAPSENLAMVGCTPQPGLGTVTYLRGTVRHRADLATCRDRVLKTGVTPPARAPGPLVTADGQYAATIRVTGHVRTLRNTIWVTNRRTGRSRAVYSAIACCDVSSVNSPGPIELLRWSGDDRWIFFAIDPGGSGSVFTAGSDRVAVHHKQLDVAGPPDWRPRALVPAPGRSWGALACAPDERSLVVQTQRESNDAGFFHTHWALWRIGLDGSQRRLTSPPAQHADESPVFSRDGKTVLFVRSRDGNGRLYALRGGKVVGPLLSLGHQDGYYGHQQWWSHATWSLAASNR